MIQLLKSANLEAEAMLRFREAYMRLEAAAQRQTAREESLLEKAKHLNQKLQVTSLEVEQQSESILEDMSELGEMRKELLKALNETSLVEIRTEELVDQKARLKTEIEELEQESERISSRLGEPDPEIGRSQSDIAKLKEEIATVSPPQRTHTYPLSHSQ